MHSWEALVFLLLACCTINLTVAQKKKRCEKGWLPLDKKNANPYRCGKYFGEGLTYNKAMDYCANNNPAGSNGQLVTIPNEFTNQQVTEIIRDEANGPYYAWIGLKRDEENPTSWRWENSGVKRDEDFEDWAPQSPNDHAARGGQDCVYINDYRREGSWNDFECQTLIQFVCQYEA